MGVGASRLDLKVIIDGYEVPVSSFSGSYQDNKMATATLSLVPTDKFFEIKPRSLICVFYLHTGYEPKVKVSGSYSKALDYKLIFVGEYVGYRFQKSSTGRQISITCFDLTNYFDYIKQHMVSFKSGGLAMTENAFMGVQFDQSSSTTLGKDIRESITNWISASKVGDKISPALGIQRIIRESFFTSNIFWSKAYNKLRIGDTIATLPEDKSSSELFNFTAFKKYTKMTLARGGGMASLRQMLGIISGPILYNSVSVPCPIIRNDDTYAGMTRKQIDETSLGGLIPKRESQQTLVSTIWKPDFWFGPPPSCNCIFPDQYFSLSFGRGFTDEPTRLQLRTEIQMKRSVYQKSAAVYNPWVFTLTGGSQPLIPAQYGVTAGAFYLRDRTIAPNFEGFKELLKPPKEGGGYKAKMHEVLLPHEKFVGPNTTMVNEGAFSRFATKKERRQYYAFYTDYLFWKFYYSGRTGTIHMKFNPNIVPGFSCVIFDKFDSESPVHFIGYVTAVSHSINQGGGNTTAQLIAMRPHNEIVDFDATGKKLTDVIFATAGKFFDERYFPNKIGEEFYKPLLGCGSIFDLQKQLLDEGEESTFKTEEAVASINEKYAALVKNNSNIHSFISSLTSREGKANLIDIFGTDDEGFPTTSSNVGKSIPNKIASKVDTPVTGFFRGTIDKESEDAKISYTSTVYKTRTVESKSTTEYVVDFDGMIKDEFYFSKPGDIVDANGNAIDVAIRDLLPDFTDPERVANKLGQLRSTGLPRRQSYAGYLFQKYVRVKIVPGKKRRETYKAGTEEKSYNIGNEIEERHAAIKAYVDSLLLRGVKL